MSPALSTRAPAPPRPRYARSTRPHPRLSENAQTVIGKRYLLKTHDGEPLEDADGMFRRVAHAVAAVELRSHAPLARVAALEDDFYDAMRSLDFLPAGRTLANAGAPTPLIPNCLVLAIEDSMDAIFRTLHDAAIMQQKGTGIGFPLHLMRPAGAVAHTSFGVSSGPVSFLRVYNEAFSVIKQQGRHGANMAVMRVDHPDILEFIGAKKVEGSIKNFNISVGLTHAFMAAVARNDPAEPWTCHFGGVEALPRRIVRDKDYNIISITPVEMGARALFDEIVSAAWNNGEPGCVFLDVANDANPLPGLGRIEATNPCGEQFLHDGDVCNLGSINLGNFVVGERGHMELDEPRLRAVVALAVRFLDNVIDLMAPGIERVEKACRNNRRVGLGIFGLADALVRRRLGYATPAGVAFAARIMRLIQEEAHDESRRLAAEKGPFPNLELSIYVLDPHRNAALTNVPPTGSISIIPDASSGVEPYFLLAYKHDNVMGGETLYHVNGDFEVDLNSLVAEGVLTGEQRAAVMRVIEKSGTLSALDAPLAAALPAWFRESYVVAGDISPEAHIAMQAAVQRWCDNSISKTINFPHGATKEDVMTAYTLAYASGCKGCTVYRDGSRQVQVLTADTTGADAAAAGKERAVDALKAAAACPDCDAALRFSEGCVACAGNCGYGRCG